MGSLQLEMDPGEAHDSGAGRAMTTRERRRRGQTVAMGEMVDHAIELFSRQLAATVGCALRFAEVGAACAAPQETALLRSVKLPELEVLTAELTKVWAMGGLADETVDWKRMKHALG